MSPHSQAPTGRTFAFRWLMRLFLINAALLSLLSLRYWSVSPAGDAFLAKAFALSATLGHCAIISFCILLPVFILAAFRVRVRYLSALSVLICGSMGIVLVADTFCYQQYRFHINAAIAEMFFGPASKEIFVFPTSMYVKMGAMFAAIYLTQMLAAFVAYRLTLKKQNCKAEWWTTFVLIFCALGAMVIYTIGDIMSITTITQGAEVPPYFPRITMRSFLSKWGIETNTVRFKSEAGGGSLSYPLEALNCSPPVKPMNVLFLVLDAWRFDMHAADVAPNINVFSKQALNFEHHSSGGSATRSGIFSLFYGLPSRYWRPMLAERRGPVLISKLKEFGYQFGIYAGAPLNSPEFDRTVFVDLAPLKNENVGKKPYERDIEIKDHFIKFLDERDTNRPFFGFIFFDAPHAFSLPKNYPMPFTPSLKEPEFMALNPKYPPLPFFNLYKNSISFNDELVGEIIAKLKEQSLLDNTIVLVTGDHGQEFNEHGLNYWGHNGNFTPLQTDVPMIVSWPGKSAQVLNHWTSHFDVAPTLLKEALGCATPMDKYSVGKSLFDDSERKFLLLGNYENAAIVEPDKITNLSPYGSLKVTDYELRSLENERPSPQIFAQVLEQQRRFFIKAP
ncbi:MAG: DUF3413 domain-containing protein [Deltaproteobacteria bacterium]|nr:DUF3413 domain-containing protein [Deltaproteobacteria bacterium]